MARLIVLDLDGTLFNTELRYQECEKMSGGNKKLFWQCFLSERFMDLDTPNQNVVSYVKSLINRNDIVVVVSGRNERQYNKTLEQLQKINIIPNEIFLRRDKDFRKDFEFKSEILSQLVNKYNPEEIIVIDDSDQVISYIQNNFVNVRVIDAKKL